jgi:hypothetical protein
MTAGAMNTQQARLTFSIPRLRGCRACRTMCSASFSSNAPWSGVPHKVQGHYLDKLHSNLRNNSTAPFPRQENATPVKRTQERRPTNSHFRGCMADGCGMPRPQPMHYERLAVSSAEGR